MHDILIGGLIALIVIIQVLVALKTSSKISLFKSIIPKENSFQTVKVFVPENQIKSIKIDYIFENIKNYTSIPLNQSQYNNSTESIEQNYNNNNNNNNNNDNEVDDQINGNKHDSIEEQYLLNNDEFPIEPQYGDELEDDEDENEFIWVTKNNVEEKIESCNLRQYQIEGWSKISY